MISEVRFLRADMVNGLADVYYDEDDFELVKVWTIGATESSREQIVLQLRRRRK